MILLSPTFTSLLTLVLVLQINCVPISDYKEVVGYLNNFGYLSNDEQQSLNNIIDNQENVKTDNRLRRALKNLQRNGNIPITGKYDKNTATLMETPRCGVSDKNLNMKRHKRYTLMSTKWSTTNLTYRFDHLDKTRFIQESDNILRIIREAFDVWEKDTIMKFTEVKDGYADILISFVHPKHTNIDPYIFGSHTLAHAFQPGRGLGGDAHFNELINWDFNVSFDSDPQEGKVSFFAVALHELGHSLGLGHTRVDDAVMYEFYSKSTSTLAEDDIRGMQHIYGVPPGKKYTPPPKKESEEDKQVWGYKTVLPDKCNTTYDAIAMIDDELIAFRWKYMFGPNMEPTEFRSRWKSFSPNTSHIDAVFQTSDKLILFFINQNVYTFKGNQTHRSFKLTDFGFDPSILKIDAIFRKSDNHQTYIFIDDTFYKFDEHKLMVNGNGNKITTVFTDVYDIDTGFTYKDGKTYFFKNQNYFEFDNKHMVLERMHPEFSGNFFMNCERIIVSDRSHLEGDTDDYIDGDGFITHDKVVDCSNPEIVCDPDSANSIKSFTLLMIVLVVTRYLF